MYGKSEFFFVKNGLLNGEAETFARRAGDDNEPLLADGWYYLVEDEEEAVGPFASEDEAKEAYLDSFAV